MSTRTIGWTLALDQPKKDPLNSERENSIYLRGYDEPLGDTQERLEEMGTSIHRFQEIYCVKQPR